MRLHTDTFIEELSDIEAEEIAAEQVQEDTISALELFEQGLTKSDIKVMANRTVESVLNQGNPLQVAEAVSAMELFIKEVKDDKRFKEYVREEVSKTPKGFTSKSGAKIECCEVGSSYNYDMTGDVEIAMLEADFQRAEANLKERKEFLKKLPAAGIDVIVPFSGEVIHIYPPAKSSTSSYKITLAK